MKNLLKNPKVRKAVPAMGLILIFGAWLAYITLQYWERSVITVYGFPDFEVLNKFFSKLGGYDGGIKLYLGTAGLAFFAYTLTVHLPRTLSEFFPSPRWKPVYNALCSIFLCGAALIMPCVAYIYESSSFVMATLRITHDTLDLCSRLYILLIPISLGIILLSQIVRFLRGLHSIDKEAFSNVTRRFLLLLLVSVLLAMVKILASHELLLVLGRFSPGAVSSFSTKSALQSRHLGHVLSTVICAPIVEEVAFRGVIFEHLKRRMPLIPAIIISSLFFGLWHRNPVQIFYTFFMGVIYAFAYAYTGKLLYPMLLHFLNNLLSVLCTCDSPRAVFGYQPFFVGIAKFFEGKPLIFDLLVLAACCCAIVIILKFIRSLYNKNPETKKQPECSVRDS